MNKICMTLLAIGGVLTCSAQSHLSENVAVDGRYLPEVVRTERLPLGLTALTPDFNITPLPGITSGRPVDFSPVLYPMTATVSGGDRPRVMRGYVDASLGSWLDGRLLAGVPIVTQDNLSLGARIDFLTTSLYHPEGTLYRRNRQDGTIGLDLAWREPHGGVLSADMQYRLAWFNYTLLKPESENILSPESAGQLSDPTQTVNDAAIRLSYTSDSGAPLRWHAGAAMRYFGYRALPDFFFAADYDGDRRATRETLISLLGGVEGDAGMASIDGIWGIDGRATLATSSGLHHPAGNGLLSLRPHWSMSRHGWQVKIGAKLDFTFNQSAPYVIYEPTDNGTLPRYGRERFSALHMAPDCSASWGNGTVGVRFEALGGVEMQTIATLADRDLYAAPLMTGSLPAYTPADLRVGFSLTPARGLSMTLEGRWKTTRHIYAGGMWTALLQSAALIEMPTEGEYRSTYYNLHGYSVALTAEWKRYRWLEATAEATWQPQKGATGWWNGYDRPEWTAGITLATNPWRTLRIEGGWQLRAKRSVTLSDALDMTGTVPLRNISDLSLGVSYAFTPRFSIGVTLDNLLNRKTELAPCLISEGFTATGGVRFLF